MLSAGILSFGLKLVVYKVIDSTVTRLSSYIEGDKHGCYRKAALSPQNGN